MVIEDREDEDGARMATANSETWSATWLSSRGSSETRLEAAMVSGAPRRCFCETILDEIQVSEDAEK
jgi:hypothetical protein